MSTFRVVMLTTAIPEEDISEYRVYVNDELEHTFLPTGVPQTEDFTVTGGARGDLMRLAAVRSSDGQEFEEQAATFTAYRPNITRFEQIGDALEGGDVTVEADVSIVEGSIDRVEVVYDGTTYQLTEGATAGTWSVEMPIASGTNDAICTAFEDSTQGLGSDPETIAIEAELLLLAEADFSVTSGDIPDVVRTGEFWEVGTSTIIYDVPRPASMPSGPNGIGIRLDNGGLELTSSVDLTDISMWQLEFEYEMISTPSGGVNWLAVQSDLGGGGFNRVRQINSRSDVDTRISIGRDADDRIRTIKSGLAAGRFRVTAADGIVTGEWWDVNDQAWKPSEEEIEEASFNNSLPIILNIGDTQDMNIYSIILRGA